MYCIGISGSSCSGKTTLTAQLAELLHAHTLNQDRFCHSEANIPQTQINGVECTNWDCFESIDFDAFVSKISSTLKQATLVNPPRLLKDSSLQVKSLVDKLLSIVHEPILILDGFLLYADARVRSLVDAAFFMVSHVASFFSVTEKHAPYTILEHRRSLRKEYITKDGTVWQDPLGYFEHVAYPEYIKNNSTLLSGVDKSITLIDTSFETTQKTLVAVLTRLISVAQ